jgi:hypothetical protein
MCWDASCKLPRVIVLRICVPFIVCIVPFIVCIVLCSEFCDMVVVRYFYGVLFMNCVLSYLGYYLLNWGYAVA